MTEQRIVSTGPPYPIDSQSDPGEAMTPPLTEMICDHCGYRFTPETPVNWCPKCARRIFVSEKQRKSHRVNTYYFYGMIITAISVLAYLFFELIVVPIMTMKPPT